MEFRVYEDLVVILELLGMTIQESAMELQVSCSTVARWKVPGERISAANLKKFMIMRSKKDSVV